MASCKEVGLSQRAGQEDILIQHPLQLAPGLWLIAARSVLLRAWGRRSSSLELEKLKYTELKIVAER